MEQTLSTDQRIDLLTNRLDERLQRIEAKMDAGFERVDRDIRELRGNVFRFGEGIMVGLVGGILALIAVIGVILSTK